MKPSLNPLYFGRMQTGLILLLASNVLHGQELRIFSRLALLQPATLDWNFASGDDLSGWAPKNCVIEKKTTNWTITAKGDDPMLVHSWDKPLSGSFALELLLRTRAKQEIMVFWRTTDQNFHPDRRMVQKIYPSHVPQSIRFLFPIAERLTGLRIDPMNEPGKVGIHRIALHRLEESPQGSILQPASGDAEIRSTLEGDPLVLRTTSRLAGAVDSITWRGREFIDSHDHGRQLQSAVNLDLSSAFHPETFNPTEAGSMDDGDGENSTSHLLQMKIGKDRLETRTQMAFWLPPGGESNGHLAKNKTVLSNHFLTKRIKLSPKGWENLILYEVTFHLPFNELHRYAQFEVVTSYMPEAFENFYGLDTKTGKLKALSDGPGEQSLPVIFSTKDEKFAMGVLSREQKMSSWKGPGYGRFRFALQKVVKWNLVYRFRQEQPIKGGPYVFNSYVGIGSLEKVRQTFVRLLATPNENLPLLD